MTSLPSERAVSRLKVIQGHVKASRDCEREMGSYTFDFAKMSKELYATRPPLFYRVQEAIEKIYARGPGHYLKTKDEHRVETNKLVIGIIKYLLDNKYVTAEEIIDQPDQFGR